MTSTLTSRWRSGTDQMQTAVSLLVPLIGHVEKLEWREEGRASSTEPPASPLRQLFHEWQAIKRRHNEAVKAEDETKEGELFDRMIALEDEAQAFHPQTMDDLLMKIIFADDNGDMDMNPAQSALARQAYEMAGLPRLDGYGQPFIEKEWPR